MRSGLDPFQFIVIAISGWMNQYQHRAIEYLIEENRVLREQIGSRRMDSTMNNAVGLQPKPRN
jgi:hypothetical protein